jgi:ankyrin repeat protein
MKYFHIILISTLLVSSSCIRKNEKKQNNDLSIEDIERLFKNNTSELDEQAVNSKDTIDFNAIIISNDSLDIQLYQLITEYYEFSDDKLIKNIEILVQKGANPDALVEYNYSVRKAGTYIPIVKHFYNNKYRQYTDNTTPFIAAVKTNKIKIIEKLLDLGANVNVPNKNAEFPIDAAIITENEKIIDLLISRGAKVSMVDLSISSNIYIIEKMIKSGADSKTIDINFALENESDLKRLLNYKPDVNKYPLDYKIVFANENLLDLLLDAGLNNTSTGKFPVNNPLIFGAVKYGDINSVKKLKAKGIDIFYKSDNHFAKSPFMEVLDEEKYEMAKYYLEQGANPNELNMNKESALIIALKSENEKLIKLLINSGAKKEYNGYFHKTPLMHAVQYNYYISAQVLINEGANLNYKNEYQESCLSVAVETKNFPMIKLLAENGADIHVKYNKMNMADYAESVNAPEMIIAYLKNLK